MMFTVRPLLLLVEPCHDVCFSVHGEFLPVHFDLVSAKLRKQDLVPNGDAHGHGLAGLGPGAGAHSNHDSFVGLGLSLLGNQQTTLGLRLGCGPLKWGTFENQNLAKLTNLG